MKSLCEREFSRILHREYSEEGESSREELVSPRQSSVNDSVRDFVRSLACEFKFVSVSVSVGGTALLFSIYPLRNVELNSREPRL